MSTTFRANVLWAKTGGEPPRPPVHPLVCHLLDVAAVATQIWNRVLPSSLCDLIVDATGQESPVDGGRLVAYWAGLHDIGKASPGFQALHEPNKALLQEAGFEFEKHELDRRHALLTTDVLCTHFAGGPTRSMASAACGLATAVGGHHGSFPTSDQRGRLARWDRGDRCGAEWEDARNDIITELMRVLSVAEPVPPALSPSEHWFFMFLAGLTSVADWIGSAEQWFPFEPYPDDLDEYFAEARRKAARAIDEIGWTRWQPSARELDFSDFFGFVPNAMQEQALSLQPSAGGRELVIIEAPMGEGKTEAALALVDRWIGEKAGRGCYIAMPTQATANAMFDRFRCDYLARRYPDQYIDLQLLHGHASLSSAYQQLRQMGQIWAQDDGPSPAGGAVVAGEWFGFRKRGLLGPFGVGTVDQALLSAMQASHSFVRLFGLAGKAVIFDEVHAFDTYTSKLLDRLLSWLAALDCPVVLLSATLPPSRRRQLVRAYAGNETEEPEVPYPRLLRVSTEGVEARHWCSEAKRVEIGWLDYEPTALADHLNGLLRNGGCAAVICNTVAAAQESFQALQEGRDDDTELDLFHARFPFDERDRREKRAISRFGKDGDRPARAVLVATQVIEQSLDLDFDVMVSEVAPVDLLLQRSGRMHRHVRQRPCGLEVPRLLLIKPQTDEAGVPQFGNSSFVYGDHLLLKTWLALQGREDFSVPKDIEELIRQVYEDETAATTEALSDALVVAGEMADQRRQQLEHEASQRRLPAPDIDEQFWALPTKLALDEDDPELHKHYRALTRWENRPSVEVVCLEMIGTEPHIRSGEGTEPVDLTTPPSEDQTKKLVRRSVRISGRAAGELLKHDVPSGWRRNSLLRHHRAVVFDDAGIFIGNTFELQLDSELGIVTPQADEGDE